MSNCVDPLSPSRAGTWANALRNDGYAVAGGLLDTREVEKLRAAFPPATVGATLHVDIDDRTPAAESWRALPHHPEVAILFGDLLGTHETRIHGSDPGRGAGAQGLHADRPPGRFHEVDAITTLWMLDDFTPENGATRIVPRSHRGASAVPRQLAQPGTAHPDEIVITGRRGDVLIFDAHLWHSGRENTCGARRRVVQMTATRSSLPPGAATPDDRFIP